MPVSHLDKDDLKAIGELIDERLVPMGKDIRSLQRITRGIRNDLESVLGDSDERELSLCGRVKRIEEHLHLIS